MSDAPYRVLFLCTGNSARSILGEYVLRHLGGGRFATASAGARPTGRVHPLALRVLRDDYGIDASDARSQPLTDLAGADFDLVLTVCDHARDHCPIFPGEGLRAHWSSPDPAAFEGPEDEALQMFRRVARQIEHRARLLVALPLAEIPAAELAGRLAEIGRSSPS